MAIVSSSFSRIKPDLDRYIPASFIESAAGKPATMAGASVRSSVDRLSACAADPELQHRSRLLAPRFDPGRSILDVVAFTLRGWRPLVADGAMDGHSSTVQAARLDPGCRASDGLFAQYRAQDVARQRSAADVLLNSP